MPVSSHDLALGIALLGAAMPGGGRPAPDGVRLVGNARRFAR